MNLIINKDFDVDASVSSQSNATPFSTLDSVVSAFRVRGEKKF